MHKVFWRWMHVTYLKLYYMNVLHILIHTSLSIFLLESYLELPTSFTLDVNWSISESLALSLVSWCKLANSYIFGLFLIDKLSWRLAPKLPAGCWYHSICIPLSREWLLVDLFYRSISYHACNGAKDYVRIFLKIISDLFVPKVKDD